MPNLHPKPKRISRATLAIALGERLGEHVHPRNVRLHRPDWLLHRCEVLDCVELYRLPLGDCAEAWTDIPTARSPFVPNNGAAFAQAMIEVEAEYRRLEPPAELDPAAQLDMDALTYTAFRALFKLDDTFCGTDDYMGIAYFWHHDYRHYLRDTSNARRQQVHKALLRAGIAVDGSSPAHETLIQQITQEQEAAS